MDETDTDDVTEDAVGEEDGDEFKHEPVPPPVSELRLTPDPEDELRRAEATASGNPDWIEHAFDPEYQASRLNGALAKFIREGYGKLGGKLNQALLTDGLSMIAKTITGLSQAFVRLDLPGRALCDISVLRNFKHLRYVSVPGNHIFDITPFNDLEFLMLLDVSDNYIESLAEFRPHQDLKVLNVGKNFLRDLLGVVDHPNLQRLYLSYNKLVAFTGGPRLLTKLETLELRKNRLKGFGDPDMKLPALKTLFLAQNNIEDLGDFSCGRNLELLDLRRNKLKSFGKWIAPALRYLNLSWNFIENIQEMEKLTGSLPLLNIVVMTNNPAMKREERLQNSIIVASKQLERFNALIITKEVRKDSAAALEEGEELEEDGT